MCTYTSFLLIPNDFLFRMIQLLPICILWCQSSIVKRKTTIQYFGVKLKLVFSNLICAGALPYFLYLRSTQTSPVRIQQPISDLGRFHRPTSQRKLNNPCHQRAPPVPLLAPHSPLHNCKHSVEQEEKSDALFTFWRKERRHDLCVESCHQTKRRNHRERPRNAAGNGELGENVHSRRIREVQAWRCKSIVPCLRPESGQAIGKKYGAEQGRAILVPQKKLASSEQEPDGHKHTQSLHGCILRKALENNKKSSVEEKLDRLGIEKPSLFWRRWKRVSR